MPLLLHNTQQHTPQQPPPLPHTLTHKCTQRLVHASLNIRIDTGYYGNGFSSSSSASMDASSGGGGNGHTRPLREAVLQALISLPESEGARDDEEEDDGDGELSLKPPVIALDFAMPASGSSGAGGWGGGYGGWAGVGGE